MELFIKQSSPVSCYFIPLMSKYSSQQNQIIKVNLSLCLPIKHYAMKGYGGVDV
jgi:hypothetical protein